MKGSFAWRLALVSALLSGGVLVVAGLATLLLFQRAQMKELDRQAEALGLQLAVRSGPNLDLERKRGDLRNRGTLRVNQQLASFTPAGRPLDLPGDWPIPDNRLEQLEFSTQRLDPQPPVPANNRGRIHPVHVPIHQTLVLDGISHRVSTFGNPELRLVLATTLGGAYNPVTQLRNTLLLLLPFALLLIALGAWRLGRSALGPVRALGANMRQVSAADLSCRLDLAASDTEFAEIIHAYNEMLARLETSFHQANRFSADASHELKTPLSIMQTRLEQALERNPSPEQATLLTRLQDDLSRQRRILESLLLLSRADAGLLQQSRTGLDISSLAKTWLEDLGILAEPEGIEIRSSLPSGLCVHADETLLTRAVHNLFSNAVNYTEAGGCIGFELVATGGQAEIRVINPGPALTADERESIWNRFARGGKGEGRSSGVGLGLSLTREIMQSHGGSATLRSTEEGNCFLLSLPISPNTA